MDSKSDLLEIADDIALHFANSTRASTTSFGLGDGLPGEAVFLAHMSRYRDRSDYADAAISRMDDVAQHLSQAEVVIPGLYGGVSGIAWAFHHVGTTLDIGDYHRDGSFVDIYEFVESYLQRRTDYALEYDLVGGLAGIGLWALTIPSRLWRHKLVGLTIDRLLDSVERDTEGVRWRTPQIRMKGGLFQYPISDPEYNLGLAHGNPGVVVFLSRCLRQDIRSAESQELLTGAVSWLASNVLPAASKSIFSNVAETRDPSRLAWCYGDLGVTLALTEAEGALDRGSMGPLISRLAESIARRKPEDTFVVDAGICHGSAGLVMLCNQLARRIGSEKLENAAERWSSALLDARKPDPDSGGFLRWNGFDKKYEYGPGYLGGLAGIGLVALSRTTGDWTWAYPLAAD